jgi:hypothetical protein
VPTDFRDVGLAEPSSTLICDDHRVTALNADRIADGDAHVYRPPLLSSLASTTARRRLTLTLAWLDTDQP